MQHHAAAERLALSETLRRTGPGAETLCGDWSAAQLAAHLVLRERSVVELLGRLPSRQLRQLAQRQIDRLVAVEPYERIVDAVAAGPSWTDAMWPIPTSAIWSLPPVREHANLLEYLVHHEDVRRAAPGWEPRQLPIQTHDAVWNRLATAGRITLRNVGIGLVLVAPSRGEIRTRLARRGAPVVTVTGDPVELAMFVFGRLTVAGVEYDGAPAEIAAVKGADISI
ncbi:MAG TPA: TIGR03085 family metal-binding protein [Jatrophihabitans sp.]|jgi:uncharacterized protein (TIGR03085 family)|nr:TIGR03085 family metal-binding protein [Jatrophihabitans sp.]